MNKFAIAALIAATTVLGSCKKDTVVEDPATFDYTLNKTSSTATWKGYLKTGYFNEGTISVESTTLQVKNNVVQSGSFVMPLSGLKNLNLPTEEVKEQLIHHLQSPDFFNMLLHPNVTFTISSVKPYTSGAVNAIEGANYLVDGDLVILGKPLNISFPAKINISNQQISVDATLKIDRTRWGMNYATEDTLAEDKYIMPEVDLTLQLQGTKM